MSPEEETLYRQRQRSRNRVLALVLLFFVALFYAITVVKFGG